MSYGVITTVAESITHYDRLHAALMQRAGAGDSRDRS